MTYVVSELLHVLFMNALKRHFSPDISCTQLGTWDSKTCSFHRKNMNYSVIMGDLIINSVSIKLKIEFLRSENSLLLQNTRTFKCSSTCTCTCTNIHVHISIFLAHKWLYVRRYKGYVKVGTCKKSTKKIFIWTCLNNKVSDQNTHTRA